MRIEYLKETNICSSLALWERAAKVQWTFERACGQRERVVINQLPFVTHHKSLRTEIKIKQ